MADNVAITAGSGTTISTDDVGGVHYQEVKLIDGTADSTTPIAVDVGGKANALRVAPANDITDGTYVGDIKFGEALPAGTNAIGKLAANSGVDIGDVDVTSVPAPLNVTGGGTEAAALRVTIANNSTGVVSVDDNGSTISVDDGGGALTVDGTVTANLSATDNTVLDNIDSNTDYGAQTGGGTEASALRVTIANNSTGVLSVDDNGGALTVDNAGTFAVQATLQNSTNTTEVVGDAAEDAAVSGNPLLTGGRYDTTARELDNGDVGAIALSVDGGVVPGLHAAGWSATLNSADASSATQVKAAGGAGKRYYLTSVVISTDTAMNVKIQDDAGTPNVAIQSIYLAANGGMVYPIPPGSAIQMGADNQDIDVLASAAGNISVTITGFTI